MTSAIAVIAAVRQRVDLLQRMLTSLVATVQRPEQVEIILRCDDDDAVMLEYMRELSQTRQMRGVARHRWIVGPRLSGYAALPAFANEAARLAHANLVLVVNDDAEFVTPGWDRLLVDRAAQYPDGMFVMGVETENAKNFIFPCVSRRLIETLGGVFDERLIYPDIWLRDVCEFFGRAVRVPDVTIAHRWQGPSPDQAGALSVTITPAYQQLYASCVADGRSKLRAQLPW